MNLPLWKCIFATTLLAFPPMVGRADDWYLNANQSNNTQTWNTLSFWKPNADGTGTSPVALSSADTYYINGKTMRSPNSDSVATDIQTFGGGVLILDNNGTMVQKSRTAIITNFTSLGGSIVDGNSSSSNNIALQVTNFTLNASTNIVNNQTASNYTLNLTNVTGSGALNLSTSIASSRITFNGASATGYTGLLTLSAGTLDFNSTFTSGGGLAVSSGANFILDQNLTFTSFTIGAATLGEGTYSFSTLKTTYTEFANSTAGSITVVPEPSTAWSLLLGAGVCGIHTRRTRRQGAR